MCHPIRTEIVTYFSGSTSARSAISNVGGGTRYSTHTSWLKYQLGPTQAPALTTVIRQFTVWSMAICLNKRPQFKEINYASLYGPLRVERSSADSACWRSKCHMAGGWRSKAIANMNPDPTTTNNHLTTSSLPDTTDMTRGIVFC